MRVLTTGILLIPSLFGCGRSDLPPLGLVTGTITLNGEPVEGGSLEFVPETGGRPAMAISNDRGEFVMYYAPKVPGAMQGVNKIRFQMASSTGPVSEADQFKPPLPKKSIPGNLKLKPDSVDVAKGQNTFHFTLEK